MKNYTKLANQWVCFCWKFLDLHFRINDDQFTAYDKIAVCDYPEIFMKMKKLNRKEFDKMVNTLDFMQGE